MGGIKKSVKNATNPKRLKDIGKAALNPWDLKSQKNVIEGSIEDMAILTTPDNSAMEELIAAQNAANNQPPMPMPDEAELKRARRRQGGSARSGRASTIMSSGETKGLGG